MQDIHENTKKENYPVIHSVAEAEKLLSEWDPTDERTESLPTFILNSISTEEQSKHIFGDSSDYHNLASEFARKGLYKHAETIAISGASKYYYNVDLLADIIKYGAQSQDWDASRKAYERLCKIDKKRWTWRCFTFSIDYFLDYLETVQECISDTDIQEVNQLIESYKVLKDERAWVADADLLLSAGKRDDAINTLKTAISTVAVAPQCCLKLSDLLLEDGFYSEVIKYAAIGLRATAQEQPSASNAYLLYISALAKDALIHQEALEASDNCINNKGFANSDAVKSALLDYDTAKQLFHNRPIYVTNIRQREMILVSKSGIKDFEK